MRVVILFGIGVKFATPAIDWVVQNDIFFVGSDLMHVM